MHVLLVPSELFFADSNSLSGCFQLHQAKALIGNSDIRVGILSAGLLPLRFIFKKKSTFSMYKIDGQISVVKYFKKSLFPVRYLSAWFLSRYHCYLGNKAFRVYAKNNGIPDILHAHNVFYAGVICEYLSKKYGIPYVVTEHSSAYFQGGLGKLKIRLFEKVINATSGMYCVSQGFKELLDKNFLPVGTGCGVIENVLDLSTFPVTKKQRRDEADEFVFIHAGGFNCIKNQNMLIHAFAKLVLERYRVKLKLIGDGALLSQAKTLVKKLDLIDKVDFYGLLSHKETLERIEKANCFVMPSLYETFGVVIIEALALGIPVISTPCGIAKEIINSSNGLIVPLRDECKLSEAMLSLMLAYDEYDANTISSSSRKLFSPQVIAGKLVQVYENVCSET